MKLLTPIDFFNKTLYKIALGESFLDVCLKFSVSPQLVILDNRLNCTPKSGDVLLIVRRGEIFTLTLEILNELAIEEIENLKTKNKVDYLFVGQILLK